MDGLSEEWRDIRGYEGRYKVSNLGRVKSLKRSIILKERSNGRYLIVDLQYNRIIKKCYIHRLVAQAFIPNPSDLPCINHKDENKLNNTVENLEWCSYSYNNAYSNTSIKGAKAVMRSIVQLTLDEHRYIKTFESIREAERELHIPNSTISACLVGRLKHAGGYYWMYLDAYGLAHPLHVESINRGYVVGSYNEN